MKTTEIERANLNLTESEKESVAAIIELFIITREVDESDMLTLFRLYKSKVNGDNDLSYTCSSCRTACREFFLQWFKYYVGEKVYFSLLQENRNIY